MSFSYFISPFVGYLAAGSLKFAVNSLKTKRMAIERIGLGGFPSTHNTITSTTFFTIAFSEGFLSSIASVALMVSIVVAIDSIDLRRKIQGHAIIINKELEKRNSKVKPLRESLGHSPGEVLFSWIFGGILGFVIIKLLVF